MPLDTKGKLRPLGVRGTDHLLKKNCLYVTKTVIEMERIPNGSQTIIHAVEEDVISYLKHFRGLHLPFAVYRLASHFKELFCFCQHNCNLDLLLC